MERIRAARALVRACLTGVLAFGIAGSAAAQAPFRIGVVEDLNGIYSGNGGPNAVLATRMAVEDHGGKVLGRPIEVIAVDHQTKPDIGSTLARQLVDQQGASALAPSARAVSGGAEAADRAIRMIALRRCR